MTKLVSVGIDWGRITGFSAWDEGGLSFAYQGEQMSMLRDVAKYIRSDGVRVIALTLEEAFKGHGGDEAKGKRAVPAALASVAAEHFTLGWLAAHGFNSDLIWRPTPSEWRKVMGFSAGKKADGTRADREEFERRARVWYAKMRGIAEIPKSRTHEAESAAMAKAGWMMRRAEDNLTKIPRGERG